MAKLVKRYYWTTISQDGLIRAPDQLGPHYDAIEMNDYKGFPTKIKARKHLKLVYQEALEKDYLYPSFFSDLILIEKYSIEDDDK